MKKIVLLILIFPGFSGIHAQSIQSQKGLTTIEFKNASGTIKVYLPQDIRPGERISGSISPEAVGKNARQMEKNLAQLRKYSIAFNGQKFPVSNNIQCTLGNNNSNLQTLNLLNSKGINEGTINLPVPSAAQPPNTSGCTMPSHVLIAAPFRIKGSFDGEATNTQCTINNIPCEIIAESNCGCIVRFPPINSGISNVAVTEKGKPVCESRISAVDMTITANKLSLMKGEKTFINVTISGLKQLPSPATLDIINKTNNVVVLQGGNQQKVTIPPASLIDSGVFRKQVEVQSIASGNFRVDFDLDLPDNGPVIFADVRVPKGGKRDEKVLTAGTRTAFKGALQKWKDANSGTSVKDEFDCPNCFDCIQAYTTESNAGDVGELGWGIITSFLSSGAKLAGGLLEKVKDIADKGGDIYKGIKELVDKGKIQVIGFKEKWCDKNEFCKITGMIVYDVATGCAEAEYKCEATRACCPFPVTTYKMKYCFDKDGAVISETESMTITH